MKRPRLHQESYKLLCLAPQKMGPFRTEFQEGLRRKGLQNSKNRSPSRLPLYIRHLQMQAKLYRKFAPRRELPKPSRTLYRWVAFVTTTCIFLLFAYFSYGWLVNLVSRHSRENRFAFNIFNLFFLLSSTIEAKCSFSFLFCFLFSKNKWKSWRRNQKNNKRPAIHEWEPGFRLLVSNFRNELEKKKRF